MFNDSIPAGISVTFLKQDLKERGWTDSMIKRWLKQPDDVRHRYGGGEYYIFHAKRVLRAEAKSDWQQERDKWRRRREMVANRQPKQVDVLRALWTLNRRAKRCRDMAANYYSCRKHGLAANAREEKDAMYWLKGQSLHWLVEEGRLSHDGYHMFMSGDGVRLWSEVLVGEGYSFHRPCARPAHWQALAAAGAARERIEAKPKTAHEARLADATQTIEIYLCDRPPIGVYAWPTRKRTRRAWTHATRVYSISTEDDDDCDEDESL